MRKLFFDVFIFPLSQGAKSVNVCDQDQHRGQLTSAMSDLPHVELSLKLHLHETT